MATRRRALFAESAGDCDRAIVNGSLPFIPGAGALPSRALRWPARSQVDGAEYGSIGRHRSTLRRNLLVEQAEKSALRCARDIFANADIRFRARFRIYAAELADAQRQFIDAAASASGAGRLRRQRVIAIPHIELNEDAFFMPDSDLLPSSLELWLRKLKRRLLADLVRDVERARDALLRRSGVSVARTRNEVHLRSGVIPEW